MASPIDQTLLSARSHALPFRVMFDEADRCRPERLRCAVAAILFKPGSSAPTADEARKALDEKIAEQERAYLLLEQNAEAIARGNPDAAKQVDGLLRQCADADRDLKKILHAMNASALCMSGGGIRSASFGLGILEGLARFSTSSASSDGLLFDIDYLSTVSGGGYIGSWLMAWVYRRWKAAGSADCKTSYQEVISAMAGQSDVTSAVPEPATVRHLRSYTSFLAPALGFSLDTFTLAAIVLRNLLVNWVMLLPVLFSVAAAVRLSGYLLISVHQALLKGLLNHSTPWIICSVFGFAGISAAFALPSHDRRDPSGAWRKVSASIFLFAVPIGSWLLSVYPAAGDPTRPKSFGECLTWASVHGLFFMALVIYGILALSIWMAYSHRVSEAVHQGVQLAFWRERWVVFVLVMIAATVMSYVVSALLSFTQGMLFPLLTHPHPGWRWFDVHVGWHGLYASASVPVVMACLSATTSLFCAVLGLFEMEEDREWWMRAGGVLLAVAIVWLVLHAVMFFGPPIVHSWALAVAGMAGGLGASVVGYSGATSAGAGAIKASQLSGLGKFLQKHDLLLPSIAGAAILLIWLGVATLTAKMSHVLLQTGFRRWVEGVLPNGFRPEFGSALTLLLLFAVLTLLANLSININLFSLHGMYRMRLMRAFLGASNVARQPDPFTNFDPQDTPREAQLPSQEGVPLHVICTTLNLVGTKNPAWRQRRGESFTFSPMFAGGWQVGYVPASGYGGTRGVSLATALSVSGAAFNPNMGYQSSPLVGFLMTFFNLRLGYWLPNPKRCALKSSSPKKTLNFLRKSGPAFALWPLLEEALGVTDDTNAFIELTDGGHFDNLGLYEMVMRRCKLIIISDAGADPQCHFEDLGNAIRKIQIDLGVPIVFDNRISMKPGFDATNRYCAVGQIRYCMTDDPGPGQTAEDLNGYLVYIKPCLNGTEDMDVQQYANVHPTFPHEATANQFFDEPQFESYRKLAYHILSAITADSSGSPNDGTIADFFSRASHYSGGSAAIKLPRGIPCGRTPSTAPTPQQEADAVLS